MSSGINMAEVSWPVIEQAFKAKMPLVIPLGAGCKEHGHHLPMNTDLIITEYLAGWLKERYQVLIAPTVQYSFFPAFTEYSGSASLTFETAVKFFVELCYCWHTQGAKQFYVLNTGMSTNKVLAQAQQVLKVKGITLKYFDFSALYRHEELKKISEQITGSHADEIETSLMLYIRPEVVDMTKAYAEENPDKPGSLTRDSSATDKTISLTGVWGNPILASLEKGKIILGLLKDLLREDVEKLFITG